MANLLEFILGDPVLRWVAIIGGFLFGAFYFYLRFKNITRVTERVEQAEKAAFKVVPLNIDNIAQLLKKAGLENHTRNELLQQLQLATKDVLSSQRLFDLYSAQIEKYQQQTRSRANFSFVFALIAMFFGLGFVFWGGSLLLTAQGGNQLAAGSVISAIGGGIGAYITKTFLDVHKLSLNQLNRYFRQPVINDHIMMAQRLADQVGDDTARKEAYEKVISSISELINAEKEQLSGDIAKDKKHTVA